MKFLQNSVLSVGLALALIQAAAAATIVTIAVSDSAGLALYSGPFSGTGSLTIAGDGFAGVASARGIPDAVSPQTLALLFTVDYAPPSAGPITLTVMATEQGLNGDQQPTLFSVSQAIFSAGLGVGAGVTALTITDYVDASNTAFGLATQIAQVNFSASDNGVFSATPIDYALTQTGVFSETIVATVTLPAAARRVTVNASISAVPEPSAIALLGFGLLVLGLGARRPSAALVRID